MSPVIAGEDAEAQEETARGEAYISRSAWFFFPPSFFFLGYFRSGTTERLIFDGGMLFLGESGW